MADAHDDAARTPSDLGPDAPPTEDELREASALARALEGSVGKDDDDRHEASDDAAFLHAIALAHDPLRAASLSPELNARLVDRAFSKGAAPKNRPGRVIRVVFGGGMVAMAAAAALVLGFGSRGPTPLPEAAKLAQSRSTQDLFREPFRADQGSARIDRIAMARSGDLRENRFERWGVR